MRPGPCTEDGFTQTTGTPSSSPSARTLRSASSFERSYCDRKLPRCGVSSRPMTPLASPIVAADEVWTTRATLAADAAAHHGRRALDVRVQHGPGVALAHRVDAGRVEDGAHPPHALEQGGRIVEVAADRLRPQRADDVGGGLAPRQRFDEPALGDQALHERSADEPRPTGDEDVAHAGQRSRALRSRRALPARAPP